MTKYSHLHPLRSTVSQVTLKGRHQPSKACLFSFFIRFGGRRNRIILAFRTCARCMQGEEKIILPQPGKNAQVQFKNPQKSNWIIMLMIFVSI